jgi:crotonobetainyl-CoA:carnitine CoA-transferase CaiB-like acyl-CoA transferase
MQRAPGGHAASRGALDGLVVVDLSRVLAGPLCTQVLSDHGADVIKVEPPGGDETRALGPPFTANGDAAYFAALNRGKRSISLDLARPEGREVLLRLLEGADVVVENFLPGTMQRWGLGYAEHLEAMFPRLVYCAITGFGDDGPLGGMPGYDAVLQAMCGLMSVNGDPQGGAMRVGIPVVDHLAGYVALNAILMALLARERSGRGQRVEATLFDTALSLLLPQAANWLASGDVPGLLGSAHPNIAPYDKFRARDGDVFLGVVNDAQFARLCAHLDRPALALDARFATNSRRVRNREALRAAIAALVRDVPAAALCTGLMQAGVPAGVVNSVPDAFAQPHARHRHALIERAGYTGVRSPARLHGTPGIAGGDPPTFARDALDVLEGAGFDAAAIARLRASGSVPG